MKTLVLAMPGNEALAGRLTVALAADRLSAIIRQFPEGETYVKLEGDVSGCTVVVACTLDRPDAKILPLLFAAQALREQRVARVGLVAPYLAYMRQDTRFQPGEAVTSTHFARVLSQHFDWLVTVDPHLHRHAALSAIYSMPAVAVHAGSRIGRWIRTNVKRPVLVGPDAEGEQWVSVVAREANAPFVILEKVRRGDRDVEVSVPDFAVLRDRAPVIVDDIISTGRTLAETLRLRSGEWRGDAQPC